MQEQKLLKRKRKATLEGNKSLLASTCIDLAELYCQEERYAEAIDEYTVVADCYKQMGKQIDFARSNRMIGEAYTQLREFDKALNYHQIYLGVARQQNDKLEEQRALATIGHTYLTSYLDDIDNPDKSVLNMAYKSFMKSLVVCESLTNISKFEHKDMMARLLANLGVVHECQGDYDKGVELVQKSINICKSHDLYEQLERNYNFLGSLYLRKMEYNNAIHQYNLAIEVAKRLKNKTMLMCISLAAKADILIKLSDFHGAKSVLLKAYKLKHPNVAERETIEHNLKVVAAMCYAEDSLLTTDTLDYKTRKSLYEKLGDGACNLKNYESAIEYYLKMLEAARNNGESGSDLSPCYISLAETYRDNKQLDLAIKYFQKDYDLLNVSTKDKVSTLLNIADCMESANRNVPEIESIYDQARDECIMASNKRLKSKVLSRHIAMLRAKGRLSQAASLEHELGPIDCCASESESEQSEEQATPDIGDEISLSNLTDVSDESDVEDDNVNRTRTLRKRGKGIMVKRNNKGETQLHTACISGNAELVRRLLDQGHPVNVRDNCGWLPIHEACIYGYPEIIETLIEKGALINDRGGTLCNGMTPLHDAASNGHLEAIQLLLDKGASVISKNDIGETPFHILKKWKLSNKNLDAASESLYNSLMRQFTESLEKLGHNKDAIMRSNEENFALVLEDEACSSTTTTSKRDSRELKQRYGEVLQRSGREKCSNSRVGNLRKNVDFDEDLGASSSGLNRRCSGSSDVDLPLLNTKKGARVTDEYKRIMENLRHPLREENTQPKRKSNEYRRSAYCEPDEVGDDWLEDDLSANTYKKRKTGTNSLVGTMGTRKPSTNSLRRQSSSSSIKSKIDEVEIPDDFFESDFTAEIMPAKDAEKTVIEDDSDDEYKSITSNVTTTKKRKHQSSLIDRGFTRHRSFSPTNAVTNFSHGTNPLSLRKQQTKLTNFGHTRNITECEFIQNVPQLSGQFANHNLNAIFKEPTLSVDVRIDGKLYRVPVAASELNMRTIKWLAEEAAQRYSRKECIKPTLELETKNGAVLADDDYISILFVAGSVQAEEVEARIVKWNLPSLSERYNEACCNSNLVPREDIIRILQETSSLLNFSDMDLTGNQILPVCKAINKQVGLHHINLSGNSMTSECVQMLCCSLPSLNNLSALNLSSNHLNSKCLELFVNMFTESPSSNILENLISLDFSFNPLKDESLRHLAIMTRFLKLQTLRLISVDFTGAIFDIFSNENIELCLDYVSNFDISYNKLGKQEILTFLSWIKPQNITNLNVSNNIDDEEGLLRGITDWLQSNGNTDLKLKSLNLSRCNVMDIEACELQRVLLLSESFKSLNLSYNESLSNLSLPAIAQANELNVIGCEKVFEDCNSGPDNILDGIKVNEMKLSFRSNQEKNAIINMWKRKYKEKAQVDQCVPGFLHLSLRT